MTKIINGSPPYITKKFLDFVKMTNGDVKMKLNRDVEYTVNVYEPDYRIRNKVAAILNGIIIDYVKARHGVDGNFYSKCVDLLSSIDEEVTKNGS